MFTIHTRLSGDNMYLLSPLSTFNTGILKSP